MIDKCLLSWHNFNKCSELLREFFLAFKANLLPFSVKFFTNKTGISSNHDLKNPRFFQTHASLKLSYTQSDLYLIFISIFMFRYLFIRPFVYLCIYWFIVMFVDFVCLFIFEFTCFLSLCFVSVYIFGCIPAFPPIKSSTKSAPCILFEYKGKFCRDLITSLLVYGDWSTINFGEKKTKAMEDFLKLFEITSMCKL